jgi:hypothetical protein
MKKLSESPTLEESADLEKQLGMGGKIKQMNFIDFIEVSLLDYEKEAIEVIVTQVETANQSAEAATLSLQKAQADIHAANNQIAIAGIAQDTVFDLVRRRAGYPTKQNWYDQNKGILIIDPN